MKMISFISLPTRCTNTLNNIEAVRREDGGGKNEMDKKKGMAVSKLNTPMMERERPEREVPFVYVCDCAARCLTVLHEVIIKVKFVIVGSNPIVILLLVLMIA